MISKRPIPVSYQSKIMNLIYQILQKFYSVFANKSVLKDSTKDISKNTTYVSGITFQITDDLELDIGCILPDLENYSIDQISDLSEKYAELLMMINGGIFRNQIFDMLKNRTKSSDDDTKKQLFINNVLSFDKILTHELNKALKNNKPLIRPTSVFKN